MFRRQVCAHDFGPFCFNHLALDFIDAHDRSDRIPDFRSARALRKERSVVDDLAFEPFVVDY